jgi:probable F420-dependent oxidoreductase
MASQREALDELVAAGFDSAWSGEVGGNDALTTIAHTAALRPDILYATSIVNVFTRGPALLAMGAATMARLLPGRFVFGIGSSSQPVVERWNGIPHVEPFQRVAETLELLDELLTTGQATRTYQTISVDGFRLPNRPDVPPRLGVGALGPRMQRLGARSADWVQMGMMLPSDLPRVMKNMASVERTRAGRAELHLGVRVAPGDPEAVDVAARRHLAGYLTVAAYAAHQRWLGRGDDLEEMWSRWAAGDRRGATAAIPDELVAGLTVSGPAEACGERLAEYFQAGADGVTVLFNPTGAIAPDELVAFLGTLARTVRAAIPR